ncbi:MAG: lysine decarboxylase, partial [Calditrichota bacterium]
IQTEKSNPDIPVVLYAGDYWRKVINLEALAEAGTISPKDLDLFEVIDTPAEAFQYLKNRLSGK